MRRWVFDASPLIALGKTGLLDLPERLAVEGVIPEAVAVEVMAGEEADPARHWLQSGPSLPIVAIPVAPIVAAWDLGTGESAAISYALAHADTEAVLDERGARTCAKALGVRARGTLGLLVLAKREGVIPAVRPHVEAMLTAGYYLDANLVALVLARAGESDG